MFQVSWFMDPGPRSQKSCFPHPWTDSHWTWSSNYVRSEAAILWLRTDGVFGSPSLPAPPWCCFRRSHEHTVVLVSFYLSWLKRQTISVCFYSIFQVLYRVPINKILCLENVRAWKQMQLNQQHCLIFRPPGWCLRNPEFCIRKWFSGSKMLLNWNFHLKKFIHEVLKISVCEILLHAIISESRACEGWYCEPSSVRAGPARADTVCIAQYLLMTLQCVFRFWFSCLMKVSLKANVYHQWHVSVMVSRWGVYTSSLCLEHLLANDQRRF